MRLSQKSILLKVKQKNKGNIKLGKAIDELIVVLEENRWQTKEEILKDRADADQVHPEGFYFFDINLHRTLVLVLLNKYEATIVWVGSHDEYERTFKNSKNVIRKYLADRSWI